MAKEAKENVTPKGEGVAEAAPVAKSVAVSRVLSEEDAISVIETYDLKSYSGEIIVTEDKNIFMSDKKNEALNHAFKQNLKYFSIQWPV
jgi:hypothetical protein